MFNSTFTSTISIETDSFTKDTATVDNSIVQEEMSMSSGDSLLNTTSRYSIEVMRNHIRLALKDFEFETPLNEVDFLLQNYEVFKVLPSLGEYFKKQFGASSRLTLELLNEGSEWQTLFINIDAACDWEKSRAFVDAFLDNMFDLFPEAAEKLNVNIDPDGF